MTSNKSTTLAVYPTTYQQLLLVCRLTALKALRAKWVLYPMGLSQRRPWARRANRGSPDSHVGNQGKALGQTSKATRGRRSAHRISKESKSTSRIRQKCLLMTQLWSSPISRAIDNSNPDKDLAWSQINQKTREHLKNQGKMCLTMERAHHQISILSHHTALSPT